MRNLIIMSSLICLSLFSGCAELAASFGYTKLLEKQMTQDSIKQAIHEDSLRNRVELILTMNTINLIIKQP